MTKNTIFKAFGKLSLACAMFSLFTQCSEEELVPAYREEITVQPDSVATDPAVELTANCDDCTYVVPEGVTVIDGKALGLQPGSIIGLSSKIAYGTLEFINLEGTAEDPIIIKNCGGPATIVATNKWHAIRTEHSKHFRITGGNTPGVYGIRVKGGEMGLKLDGLSTNFEVDHVEVLEQGFAGIMAKTDPSCDDATIRGNFTMYDVSLHDNYVHDTGGEGFYVGNSFWDGMQRDCGIRLPHEIRGLKIFNNVIRNTGWEALQVGCAIEGTEIYNNTIENYGAANKLYQNNGIQLGSGTGGVLYNNLVKNGPGNGLIIMGTGDNVIYNNIIVNAGENGVFCDERFTPGEGFKFVNNTILSPKQDGIRLYSEKVPMNTIINNIIANPGTLGTYSGNRSREDAFVYRLNEELNATVSNNVFADTEEEVQFVNCKVDNYRLKEGSPAINVGMDVSKLGIDHDFYESRRLNGSAVDAGAIEF